jgi:hypothetical protein
VSADSPIKGTIYHLILVSPLEHQEECSKEISSGRVKADFGKMWKLLYVKHTNVLEMFMRFPGFACTSIL